MFPNFFIKLGKTIIVESHRKMSLLPKYNFKTLLVSSPQTYVYHIEMNNPAKKNSMKLQFAREIKECLESISDDADCRCAVLSGVGSTFSSGVDLTELVNLFGTMTIEDPASKAFILRRFIISMQSSFTSLEKCLKPIIAAVHGPCIGGALDMICAADIRMASEDAYFQVKEVALGLSPDVGTIQRLPRLVGSDSLAREFIYTARKMASDEALSCGLVSVVVATKEALIERALKKAGEIAEMSPVAIQASKAALVYSRDHTVEDGLRMQADWNQVMLQSEDVIKAMMAIMSKQKAKFAKL